MTPYDLHVLLRTLVLPPSSNLILALAGLLFWPRRPRLGVALCAIGIVSLWLLATPIIADALARAAEGYPPLDPSHLTAAQARAQAIVILEEACAVTRPRPAATPQACTPSCGSSKARKSPVARIYPCWSRAATARPSPCTASSKRTCRYRYAGPRPPRSTPMKTRSFRPGCCASRGSSGSSWSLRVRTLSARPRSSARPASRSRPRLPRCGHGTSAVRCRWCRPYGRWSVRTPPCMSGPAGWFSRPARIYRAMNGPAPAVVV